MIEDLINDQNIFSTKNLVLIIGSKYFEQLINKSYSKKEFKNIKNLIVYLEEEKLNDTCRTI